MAERARGKLLARHEAAARDERGVSAPPEGGARGRADGRPRSARRPADQGRVPPHDRARRRDPHEHAHPRGRAGDVRSHQHHPEGQDHRARHGVGAPRAGRRAERRADAGVPQAHGRERSPGDRGDRMNGASAIARPFPYLLLPSLWATRNRARRREGGDTARAAVFGGIGLGVMSVLFSGAFWVTWQAAQYAELGDYLIRIGLSWLFLTFLSFLTFSGVVASLSTFFLSDDLRLILAAAVAPRRLFCTRFARSVLQAGWVVLFFLLPLLGGIAFAKCASWCVVVSATMTVVPFVVIPVALGSVVTLVLVNVVPARRARDILMLMGLVFAISIVLLLRFIQPERLLRVESMPEVTDFFATLQSPITPLLPSFWAGEALFAGLLK